MCVKNKVWDYAEAPPSKNISGSVQDRKEFLPGLKHYNIRALFVKEGSKNWRVLWGRRVSGAPPSCLGHDDGQRDHPFLFCLLFLPALCFTCRSRVALTTECY